MCYVVNTFLLLVLDKHHLFYNPVKIHVMELILCTTVPLIFVGICILVKKPGYHMMFKDRLAILPSSYILIFATVTLPVVISAGTSLTMLVAVVRNIRKVSKKIFVVRNHSLASSYRSSRIPINIIYERSPLLIFSYTCGAVNLGHQTSVHQTQE